MGLLIGKMISDRHISNWGTEIVAVFLCHVITSKAAPNRRLARCRSRAYVSASRICDFIVICAAHSAETRHCCECKLQSLLGAPVLTLRSAKPRYRRYQAVFGAVLYAARPGSTPTCAAASAQLNVETSACSQAPAAQRTRQPVRQPAKRQTLCLCIPSRSPKAQQSRHSAQP